ncbi:MAG: hypothetical protein M5R42_13555 [Rhodocyclaceae bacterium]|nr:hypothetical protein [Rhodocyclaceae bacterium]
MEQTHARHILIKTSELVSESEAKRRLVGLKERITHGTEFAEACPPALERSLTRQREATWAG